MLTSENLRAELMTLWAQPDFPTNCIRLYAILTGRDEQSAAERAATPGPLTHPLPDASVGGLAGLIQSPPIQHPVPGVAQEPLY